MTDAQRRAQERRERMVLRKGHLGDPEIDMSPVFGAEALTLVHRLTRMSYALANQPLPSYCRAEIPCNFVRRPSR
jgi:hypothetical protein